MSAPEASNQQISIHALLAESDPYCIITKSCYNNFYPRSPCGERHFPPLLLRSIHEISIHALLAERDRAIAEDMARDHHFYPRSPCGERRTSRRGVKSRMNFYPRSPCGERQTSKNRPRTPAIFLSTLSLRRATGCSDHCNP